ncbi:MAG: FAD-dependent oxidoreductase [Chloroflexota bacterium]|nr:MAG: FAD-dependent oxidoreductase [Chloroflexota bacterium]
MGLHPSPVKRLARRKGDNQVPGRQKFEKLLQPLKIQQIELRNRIVCTANSRYFATDDGYTTDLDLGTYEALARGGVGLIVVQWAAIDYPVGFRLRHYAISDDKYIPGLTELAAVIHKHGCPAFLQLCHKGPLQEFSDFNVEGVAPSSIVDVMPAPSHDFHYPRELTIAEIQDLVAKFANAAERARRAGFDGVEIHAAAIYLVAAFMSRIWNKRNDAYGCQNLESRARFAVEIIRAIKERVGQDFPVGIRINGQEWGHQMGITPEESEQFALMLEKAGADYISVLGIGFGQYEHVQFAKLVLYPEPSSVTRPLIKQIKKPGVLVPAAERIKRVVSVPVVAVAGLDPKLGEWLLQHNKADLIGMVRPLIADPELPNKVARGRLDDIAPCTACVECLGRVWKTKPLRCRINAALGREREYTVTPSPRKKSVVVIGGGPGGMEAARTAALRGHEVLLYEKEHKLGGSLPLASLVKGFEIEDLDALVRYFKLQLNELGVKTRLGTEATPALIKELRPDAVVVATGGAPETLLIPGIDKRKVLSSSDLQRTARTLLRFISPKLLRRLTRFWMPIGRKVVIVGGLMHGCQLAEFLLRGGREVTIVETTDELGTGIPEVNRPRLLSWLADKGVTMMSGVKYEEITDKGLRLTTREGHTQTIEADTILTAIPPRRNTELFETLQASVPEIYLTGDCREPGKIIDAIADGRRVGCSI